MVVWCRAFFSSVCVVVDGFVWVLGMWLVFWFGFVCLGGGVFLFWRFCFGVFVLNSSDMSYCFSKLKHLGMTQSHVLSLEQQLRTRVLKYFGAKLNSKLIKLRKKYIF